MCNLMKKFNMKHNYYYNYDKVNYINAKTNITIICPIHGEFNQTPDNHLQGKGCKLCGLNKLKILFTKTKEDFVKESNIIHNNKFCYDKSTYINISTKLIITCLLHGDFLQMPNKHLSGQGCPNCKKIKTAETFNQKYSKIFFEKAKTLHNNIYSYNEDEYVSMKIPIKILCKKHGIFSQTPDNHLQRKGCPNCNKSIGESLVEKWLMKNNILYKRGKYFKDCKNKSSLPFDFYLPDYNICIEFDGIQHFKPINFFGGDKKFKYVQKNDKIKNEYCLTGNIHLIRIPYFKIKEIDLILDEIFKNIC